MSMPPSVTRRPAVCATAMAAIATSLVATAPAATATPLVTITPRNVLASALHADQVKLGRVGHQLAALSGSPIPAARLRAEVHGDRAGVAALHAQVRWADVDCPCAAAWRAETRLSARITLVQRQAHLAAAAAADGLFAWPERPIDVSDAVLNMSPAHASRAREAARDLAAAGDQLTKIGDSVRRLLRVPGRHATNDTIRAQAQRVRSELRALRRSSAPAAARVAITRLGRQLELAGYGIAPRPGQHYAAATRAAARATATRLSADLARLLNAPSPVSATAWALLRPRLVQWRTELDGYRSVLDASRDEHLVGLTIQLVAARRHDVAALTRAVSLADRAARLAIVTGGHGDTPQLRAELLHRLTAGAISQSDYDNAIIALADHASSLAVLEGPAADMHSLLDPAGPDRFTRDAALASYTVAVAQAAVAKARLAADERAVVAAL